MERPATCDFRFRLYNAASGGTLLGTDTVNGVPVSDGYFGVVLNDSGEFGANAFNGQARWLEIRVNCGSGDGLTLWSSNGWGVLGHSDGTYGIGVYGQVGASKTHCKRVVPPLCTSGVGSNGC